MDWSEDIALCLDLMLEPGDLFDLERACRAEALLRRLHPRFGGDVRGKLREQLGVLAARGVVREVVQGEVYRWVGRAAGAGASPWQTPAAAPAPARERGRPQPVAAAPAPAPRKASAPTAEAFAAELKRRLTDGQASGKAHIHVSAFDLHRSIAPYPAPNHRMPLCCQVMRAAMRDGDQALTQAEKDGPELLVRYTFPRR